MLATGICFSAGSQQEAEQLQQINNNSIKKMEDAKKALTHSINQIVGDMPEEKDEILDLARAWGQIAKKKCELLIHDSLNTDAEISARNDCLSSEYHDEKVFFEKINL